MDVARCGCGGAGCLESLIRGDAIVDRHLAAGGRRASTPEETQDDLIADADLGRPEAARVLDGTAEVLGLGLANLVNLHNLLNPARIVVGGWSGRRLLAARVGGGRSSARCGARGCGTPQSASRWSPAG